MIELNTCSLTCRNPKAREAEYSKFFRINLVAIGSLSCLISILIFFRVPGLNLLGTTTTGWVYFGIGTSSFLTGLLCRCNEKRKKDSQRNIQRNQTIARGAPAMQAVEPCPYFALALKPCGEFSPFDLIPQELLDQIFFFLNKKELKKIPLVCKPWWFNRECLSKKQSLQTLNSENLVNRSWYVQYKIIENWKSKKAHATDFTHCFQETSEHSFTLLEDGRYVEIFKKSTNDKLWTIRDLTTNICEEIDVSEFARTRIIRTNIYEQTWTILDELGNVFGFDLGTNECLYSFSRSVEEEEKGATWRIYCNKFDLVTYTNKQVIVRNLLQKKNPLLIKNPTEDSDIRSVFSTPNFVIVEGSFFKLTFINKKSLSKTVNDISCEPRCLSTFGCYFAFLNRIGDLKIFKDLGDELKLVRTIKKGFERDYSLSYSSASYSLTSITLYHNWAIATKNGALKVWDIEKGNLLTDLQHRIFEAKVVTNFTKLLLKSTKKSSQETYLHRLYDFSFGMPKQHVESLSLETVTIQEPCV